MGSGKVYMSIRPDGDVSRTVYGVTVTEGIVTVGSTLTAPNGATARIDAVVMVGQSGERMELPGAPIGANVVLETTPVLAIDDGTVVHF